MWQALVTACFIANMDQCVVLEGQQWFESEARCKARAFRDGWRCKSIYEITQTSSIPMPEATGGNVNKMIQALIGPIAFTCWLVS
jgi:hypothetical protein